MPRLAGFVSQVDELRYITLDFAYFPRVLIGALLSICTFTLRMLRSLTVELNVAHVLSLF